MDCAGLIFFTEKQRGVWPNLGINNSISRFLDYIHEGNNNSLDTLTLYYDLKKAFDNINHTDLLAVRGEGLARSGLKLLEN